MRQPVYKNTAFPYFLMLFQYMITTHVAFVTEMFWSFVLCRGLNTVGVETQQETALRRQWQLWMEPSTVSETVG